MQDPDPHCMDVDPKVADLTVLELLCLIALSVRLGEGGEEGGEDAGQVAVQRLARHAGQDGQRLRVNWAGRQLRHQVG